MFSLVSDERKLTMIVFPFHCIFHAVHLVALPHFYIVPKISLYIFKKSWIIALKCMENMGRGWQGTVDVSANQRKSFSSSFFLSLHPPAPPPCLITVFSYVEIEHQRCDRMLNEAIPWPSKHFLCLAQVFSCFTPTSGEAENKKSNSGTKTPETKWVSMPSGWTFVLLLYSLRTNPWGTLSISLKSSLHIFN